MLMFVPRDRSGSKTGIGPMHRALIDVNKRKIRVRKPCVDPTIRLFVDFSDCPKGKGQVVLTVCSGHAFNVNDCSKGRGQCRNTRLY